MNSDGRRPQIAPARLLILALLAAMTLYGLGKYVRGLILGVPDRGGPHGAGAIGGSPAAQERFTRPPAPPMPPSGRPSSRPSRAGGGLDTEAFRARYGRELRIERAADGRPLAVRGAPSSGERASAPYDSRNSAQVLARAREVRDAASRALELEDADLDAIAPDVQVGETSSQVRFAQSLGGTRIEPGGSVRVDLGARGEILNVDADVTRDLRVVNERRLSSEQAQEKARAAVTEQPSGAARGGFGITGGAPIVWVEADARGGGSEGRHAYGYTVEGYRIVIDAGDGKVLYQKDRRQF